MFAVAAVMALIFELVYNITNARMYWDSEIGYEKVDENDKGNINYVDGYDKVDYEYDQTYFDDPDYPTQSYPISRNIQNSFNPRLVYRPQGPQAFVPAYKNFGVYPGRRFIGAPSLMNVSPYRYNSVHRNTLVKSRPWTVRRSGVEQDQDEDTRTATTSTSSSSMLNWRYLLGLPPWFLKD